MGRPSFYLLLKNLKLLEIDFVQLYSREGKLANVLIDLLASSTHRMIVQSPRTCKSASGCIMPLADTGFRISGVAVSKPQRTFLMIRCFVICLSLFFSFAAAHGQLEELEKRAGLGNASNLSDSKVASGLQEALQIGADNAVKLTGKTDGYFKNQAIKILMPSNLRPMEKGLRMVGFGPKIDEFILSMNRSAEAAAPAARKIFVDAILAMSFDDAKKILSGGDTAATDYFKNKTSGQLTAAFQPFVEKTMNENGVTQQYNTLTEQYKSIPFARSQSLDINKYVVAKAMDGLFYELGEQERQIRKDPAARTTSLLKQVFGQSQK
jgi:hypothetical protein